MRSPSQWPGHGPVVDLGGPFADHHHVGDAASGLDPVAGAALGPAGAQAAGELAAQLSPPLDVDALVDRLVRHPHHRIVGELDRQAASDLLRRPPRLEPLGHLGGEPGTASSLAASGAGPARRRGRGPARPGSRRGRRWRSPPVTPSRSSGPAGGHSGEGVATAQAEADLFPLLQRQPTLGPGTSASARFSRLPFPATTRFTVRNEQPTSRATSATVMPSARIRRTRRRCSTVR